MAELNLGKLDITHFLIAFVIGLTIHYMYKQFCKGRYRSELLEGADICDSAEPCLNGCWPWNWYWTKIFQVGFFKDCQL